MIFDKLSNAQQYKGLHPAIDQVLDAATAYHPDNFPSERVVLDGDRVYMNMASYETHSAEGASFEAHKRYADVMVIVEGVETIYVKPTDRLSHVYQEYNPQKDILMADFDTDAIPVRVEAGDFVVLFPQDAHAPGCHAGEAAKVKKIVGKICLDL